MNVAPVRPVALDVAIVAVLPAAARIWRDRALGALAGISAFGLALGDPVAALASSTYVVTTSGDPGPTGSLSLRQAVALANGSPDNTIEFDGQLVGSTITLTDGQIEVTQPMAIRGPGATQLTISGNDDSRILYVNNASAGTFVISDLRLTRGHAVGGGGAMKIVNSADLTSMIIDGNVAEYGGGVFAVSGDLRVRYSSIRGNSASSDGGGIDAFAVDYLAVFNSTVSGNSAAFSGGGISIDHAIGMRIAYSLVEGNTLGHPTGDAQAGGGIAILGAAKSYIYNSTISGNFAPDGGGGGIGVLDTSAGHTTRIGYSTIVGNSTSSGDDNGLFSAPGATTWLNGVIVANNFSAANQNDLVGNFGATLSLIKSPGSAVIGGDGNLFGADPQLGPLRDNGGPTWTMLPAPTSPVIHRIPIGIARIDQRGIPRFDSGFTDMGAVERQPAEDILFRDGFDGN